MINKNELTVIDLIRKLEKLDKFAVVCFDGKDIDLDKFPSKEHIIDKDYYYFYLK